MISRKRDAPTVRANQKKDFNNFDQKEIVSKQKILQIKYREALDNHSVQCFQKFKYGGSLYEVGQFVELFHFKSKAPYVAKINKIIKVNQENQAQEVPFLEVEWYMNKSEVSQQKITSHYYQCLSNNEVFASEELFYIYIQSIISKCQVINFQQYWNISQSSPGIYFTRAAYDSKTKLLTPQPSTWKKFCYCNVPYNPDLQYVQCQTCHEWIHSDCDPEECSKDNFICKKCRVKSKSKK